ncbi:GNAT family N-acetyltransferase [Vibrio penaeicida]|uniref:GNAT family N-acetyltransferase n=1 Tax=Vibrio penaeicida TaxID=104609 RepID=UPI002735C519|nr:GNAT family N-acetyltransferase [Vibrio penaeicida]MDP2572600.1 GNAT family N-acetyltransferase [Vibrio penaeicida]
MNNVDVVPISSEDTAHKALQHSCFQALRNVYSPRQTAHPIQTIRTDNHQAFGALILGTLVGSLEAQFDGHSVSIQSVAVDDQYRKQGLAGKMIKAVMGSYASAQRVSLWCVEQTGNVSIFEKIGFKVTQRIESDILILTDGSPAIEVQMTIDVKRKE